ncbi:Secreted protein [Phytophthora cinnamomi]|uniref:Secreted protein n=1 Tax=Phytophthora cinnamomi TaxID=4785 RepID=UPI0035595BC7|nr:Secreted protein [Phytophthora cinnamomi]
MITRGTTDQVTPSSPSSRLVTAPSDSDDPAAGAGVGPPDVLDVTGADEPWATTPAKRTSDPAPLRTNKRATPRPASGEAMVDASKGKKKVAKSATVASTAGTPRKTAGDSGYDSDSDVEDKPPAPPAKWPKKTVVSAKAKESRAVGPQSVRRLRRGPAAVRSARVHGIVFARHSTRGDAATEERAVFGESAAQASAITEVVVAQNNTLLFALKCKPCKPR